MLDVGFHGPLIGLLITSLIIIIDSLAKLIARSLI